MMKFEMKQVLTIFISCVVTIAGGELVSTKFVVDGKIPLIVPVQCWCGDSVRIG